MNKIPINPVTIRGRLPDSIEPSNLSIGRLWIGTTMLPPMPVLAGGNDNPSKPLGIEWITAKPVTFILWGFNIEAPPMVSSEENFIDLVKNIQTKEIISITLRGNESVSENSKEYALVFARINKDLKVTQVDNDNKIFGVVLLSFDNFIEGLGHLFPNSKIDHFGILVDLELIKFGV